MSEELKKQLDSEAAQMQTISHALDKIFPPQTDEAKALIGEVYKQAQALGENPDDSYLELLASRYNKLNARIKADQKELESYRKDIDRLLVEKRGQVSLGSPIDERVGPYSIQLRIDAVKEFVTKAHERKILVVKRID